MSEDKIRRMSLGEYTAAMQAMLASAGNGPTNDWSYYVLSTRAVEYADALIAELDKEPQP